jgi:integrase
MPRHQTGYIWRVKGSWYGRWREDVIENGAVSRKQRSEKLADVCDRYRTKAHVRPLLQEKLRPLNEGRANPQSTLTVAEYAKLYFLPRVEAECKPSTVNGYQTMWRMYLEPRLGKVSIRDFRCVDATNLLADIHRRHGIGRATLRHCKALLSSIFTFAKQQGVVDGINPVQDAGIPRKAAVSKPTHASTPEEVLAMLNTLTGTARIAVALIYFCGLRPGEARGARWEDYDGRKLFVCQSVWRTHVTAPKTAESASAVPVCETLAEILEAQRKASGYILSGPTGKPLNLNNLGKRVVLPTLRKAEIPWHGWYALRRGLATLAARVDSPLAAKGLLRHSNIATTQQHYIKDVPEEAARAVERIDALFNRALIGPVQ